MSEAVPTIFPAKERQKETKRPQERATEKIELHLGANSIRE